MDAKTVAIYERDAQEWRRRRGMAAGDAVLAFARRCPPGVRVDLGCGPGRHTVALGTPVLALDAAAAMLLLVREVAPAAWVVQADLEAPPLRRGALRGVWARSSYVHVPRVRLPLALARLHAAMAVDARLHLDMFVGSYEGDALPDDDFPGRFFAQWDPDHLQRVVTGAGFVIEEVEQAAARAGTRIAIDATRGRTLPDTVGPGMNLLVCGLNPSLYSADAGAGFARPGNRFWPAAIAAGLVREANDPVRALLDHGVGMTDLVKRATVASAELHSAEYREGYARVEALVAWLEPHAVCFVGLEGWRAAVDRKARAGWQARGIGGRPAYVMPSTSGLNAHASREVLTEHLRAAAAGP